MAQAALPLTALSEAQRTQALEGLEDHPSGFREARLSSTGCTYPSHSPSTIQLWIKHYREKGPAGLSNAMSCLKILEFVR
ncbi:MAG TPA: helix-turn-helix domain-containing protein [Ktedonobacteraceae bacterium]|nr:helix-turn-helix domain-containing protein [Ktedonobacteraceae bacterium]